MTRPGLLVTFSKVGLVALCVSLPALGLGLAVEAIETTRLEAARRSLAEARVSAAARTLEEARDAARRGAERLCAEDVGASPGGGAGSSAGTHMGANAGASLGANAGANLGANAGASLGANAGSGLGLVAPSGDPITDRARARVARLRAHGLELADVFAPSEGETVGAFLASSHARGRQPFVTAPSAPMLERGALVTLTPPHEGLSGQAIVVSCRAGGLLVVAGVSVDLARDPRLSGVSLADAAAPSAISLPTEIAGARRVVATERAPLPSVSRTLVLAGAGALWLLAIAVQLLARARARQPHAMGAAGPSGPEAGARDVEREVREAAAKLSRGDFDVQLHAGADATQNAFNQMTRELARARARAVKAERIAAWRDIARRIAHEIKNPLTPIKMAIETMRKTFSRQHPDFPEIFDESTRAVLEEVERMEKIVTEFSRFARLPRPNASRISPLDIAVHVVSMHEVQNVGATSPDTPRAPRVKLDIDPDFQRAGAPRLVRADREQITQVLMNLVQNAIDAAVSKRGIEGANVLVRLAPGEVGGAVIEVHDDGPGIPAEERPRVFEPYYTTKAHGTGLGLPICDRIVSDHGGTLTVDDSPPLGGARFTVTLSREGPLDEADASQTV